MKLSSCLAQAIAIATALGGLVPSESSSVETTEEYHERMNALLEEAFLAQNETTAWWVGFSHPTHGDNYWIFGNSSDTDGSYPPNIAATVDDHFYIGSISKSMGATVNLQLIEQGLFGLNDTVQDIVPDFAAQFPEYANNTPRELMSMQTQVPDFLNDPEGFVSQLIADPTRRFTIPELVDFAMQKYPAQPPDWIVDYVDILGIPLDEYLAENGVQVPYTEYSTTNIVVMEYIAEAVTGKPMQDLIEEYVTGPLGLSNTAEPLRDAPSPILPEPAVVSYKGQGCVQEIQDTGGTASIGDRFDAFDDSLVNFGSGGSVYSTIIDLLQWAKSGLGDSLISNESREARHVLKQTGIMLPYGLGIHAFTDTISDDPTLGDGWFGHGGDAFSSTTRAWKNDELNAAFASAISTCNYGTMHSEGFKIIVGDFMSGAGEPMTESPSPNGDSTTTGTPTSAPETTTGAPTSNSATSKDGGESKLGDATSMGTMASISYYCIAIFYAFVAGFA